MLGLLALSMAFVFAPTVSHALVFASPDTEPKSESPSDFPYWEHVTQRRYEGPSVVYLGEGFAITARHVGMGEIFLAGEIYEPVRGSGHALLNPSGGIADAMVFELDREKAVPDWPMIPIADSPPKRGEDLLMIGFGKGRKRVVQFEADGDTHFAFEWTRNGEKRWGTNRVSSPVELLVQKRFSTRAFTFDFDAPFAKNSTRYEAQAAVGDSGGGVFVKREGAWQLIGLMVSVSGDSRAPDAGTVYGDRTYVADLTHYREEIFRWTRTACSNEVDDDQDGLVDYPVDPGCDGPLDRSEHDSGPSAQDAFNIAVAALAGIFVVLGFAWRRARASRA